MTKGVDIKKMKDFLGGGVKGELCNIFFIYIYINLILTTNL